MEKKQKYNGINLFVVSITGIYFIFANVNVSEVFEGQSFFSILALLVTVVLVHIVKAGRLYFALYDSNIKFMAYLKTYCKVTPVSVVLPFKIGEFFRMYCYGKQLGNILKGIVIILFDRFMDTIALVTAILLVWIFNGGHLTVFIYLLLILLMLFLIIYFVFPGIYQFWRKALLRSKATENKIVVLKILETLNFIYLEIEGVVKGKGVILYFLSLAAWGVEIGSLVLFKGGEELNHVISKYLTSAMSEGQLPEFNRFVFTSVVVLILVYGVLKMYEIIIGKEGD